MFPMAQIGMKDAENVIKLGENRAWEALEEWHSNEALRQEYPYFEDLLHSLKI